MTSQKQIEANRLNALKSTGPRTEHGKRRSRRNAFRHGLTAETVVKSLEDARLYRLFQAAIISDYAPLSAVEHELVLRLASLLWRLRRVTAIESGLLEIHGTAARDDKSEENSVITMPTSDLYRRLGLTDQIKQSPTIAPLGGPMHCTRHSRGISPRHRKTSRDIAARYLRLEDHTNGAFERFGRYEARLWRQTRGIIAMLEAMRGSLSKGSNRPSRHAVTLRDDFAERSLNRLW
jgi:hypothetical protein